MVLKGLSTKKKVIIVVVVAVVGLLTACGAYALSVINNYHYEPITSNASELGIAPENNPINDDGSVDITNIALFGVDSREEGKMTGNSDSIMIMSVDKLHNKIKLTSIMRDSYVYVEGKGDMKMTEVYGCGGAQLAIKTLNQNFGTNIYDYATVNFSEMAKIVDAVGGVEINVSQEELVNANASIGEQAKELGVEATGINEPGLQTLNGIQAVGYARIRKANVQGKEMGDFGRTDRQREVMEQLFNKALHMSFWEYPAFINKMLPYVETSLDYAKIIDLASIMTRQVTFEQSRVPLMEYTIDENYYIGSKSYVYYNLNYASKVLKAFIYDDIAPEVYVEENTPPKQGTRPQTSSKPSSSKPSNSSQKSNKQPQNNDNPDHSSETPSKEIPSSKSEAPSSSSKPPDDAPSVPTDTPSSADQGTTTSTSST